MENRDKTQSFFNEWDEYHKLIADLDSYRYPALALRGEIRGRMLDIGNGGIFNYDTTQASEIVVVDVAKDLMNGKNWPANATFTWGDAVHLPVEPDTFDTALLQFLMHHLAEHSYAETRQRTRTAVEQAFRALKPGGRLLIVESCLPLFWEKVQEFGYPMIAWIMHRLKHPLVFQWNWNTLAGFAREAGFVNVELTRISLGRWVIQLGRKWPRFLTPIQLYKITAQKPPG